jgi:hypothetical protein
MRGDHSIFAGHDVREHELSVWPCCRSEVERLRLRKRRVLRIAGKQIQPDPCAGQGLRASGLDHDAFDGGRSGRRLLECGSLREQSPGRASPQNPRGEHHEPDALHRWLPASIDP